MSRQLMYPIALNKQQLVILKKKYGIKFDSRLVININTEIKLLMFNDKPVLLINRVTDNIETFELIKLKYMNLLKISGRN